MSRNFKSCLVIFFITGGLAIILFLSWFFFFSHPRPESEGSKEFETDAPESLEILKTLLKKEEVGDINHVQLYVDNHGIDRFYVFKFIASGHTINRLFPLHTMEKKRHDLFNSKYVRRAPDWFDVPPNTLAYIEQDYTYSTYLIYQPQERTAYYIYAHH
ncbi:MAG: hypothetical protein R3345_07425 [Fulvivirga sp.]|nr:hypothetical protein [Fulvivirga sp.]